MDKSAVHWSKFLLLAIAFLAFTPIAFGAEPPATEIVGVQSASKLTDIALGVWSVVGGAVITALGILLRFGIAWLNAAVKKYLNEAEHTKFATATNRLSDAAFTTVRFAEATIRPLIMEARAANSPGGTTVTPEEGADIKTKAIAAMKQNLGEKGIHSILDAFGLKPEELEALLSARIESALYEMRQTDKAIESGTADLNIKPANSLPPSG